MSDLELAHGGFHEKPACHGGMKLPCFVNPEPPPPQKPLLSPSGENAFFSEIACQSSSN